MMDEWKSLVTLTPVEIVQGSADTTRTGKEPVSANEELSDGIIISSVIGKRKRTTVAQAGTSTSGIMTVQQAGPSTSATNVGATSPRRSNRSASTTPAVLTAPSSRLETEEKKGNAVEKPSSRRRTTESKSPIPDEVGKVDREEKEKDADADVVMKNQEGEGLEESGRQQDDIQPQLQESLVEEEVEQHKEKDREQDQSSGQLQEKVPRVQRRAGRKPHAKGSEDNNSPLEKPGNEKGQPSKRNFDKVNFGEWQIKTWSGLISSQLLRAQS